ncbi:vitamin B12 transporter [Mucilaginibacter lappiensis]|uniref:Vitamin B12 transporter n=1 Tax=Mucilaginibacter lappiensis TaxID=354630 RepID=A0ABR6PE84_9SPHI|nr:TonB-dependent receptor [Mucilaginibacter lappiensis]MBB6108071.1 vitamin B12 transporter [Mucilaginibacter lappiensis]SIP88166.1 vitamin B12 transporter [Mucilaginibacter lappiensis]
MEKIYFKSILGIGLLHITLLAATVQAQDTTRLLNNVVVTATRSPKKLSDIGRVVTVISAEQINRSQGKTLPQLLNTVPGLTFSGAQNAPGIATSIYLRGASTGNTLILIDGFPVNNASAIDGSYDLNAFSLDMIDHIEILKGSGSTLYGSDAVAGVINIITKKGKGQGLKGSLQLMGGSYNTFKESASLNGTVDKTGVAVNISNSDSRGFAAATDTTGKGNFKKDGFHQRSASVNISQAVSKNFSLNGNLQTSYTSGNLPYGAFTDDQNYTYNNTFLFGGLGAKLILPAGALVVNLSQNDVWNNFNNLPTDNNSGYQVTKNRGKISNAEAILNYALGKYFDITSGTSFKYSNTNQYSLFLPTGDPDIIKDRNNNIFSAYTSLFFKDDIFHMELGGRYNHHSTYGDNFTYTINPSLFLADQFKVFGTIASAYKSPSLYQLYSQYGNGGLKPETTTSYEAGFDWEIIKNTLTFNTQFYKRNAKDVIYFANLSVSPYGVYQNGQFQKDKGFESELNYHSSKLTASAYYTYVTGKLTDEKGLQTANLYRRPKSTFGLNFTYQVIDDFSFGVNYKYTGNRTDQNFATYPSTIVTLKHYNLADLHLELKATRNLRVFGDLNNVLDQKYTDWLGYNTMGINFMLGAKYQFN